MQVTGRLISLDGIDGVGKTTQIKRLNEYLQSRGFRTLCVSDPGSTEIGSRLRAILLDSELTLHRRTEAMLFMASRCEMIETIIRPALADGQIVICDRFLLANVVYQSVGNGVTASQLWQMGDWANQGLRPDITLLLDMPAEVSIMRLDRPADRMEARGLEYLQLVRDAFLRELPKASAKTAVIDAGMEIEFVSRGIRRFVDEIL